MVSGESLLARYGSPLFRYDLAEVRRAVSALRWALPAYAMLFYSVKANPHPDVVAEARRGGCRAEVSSGGEVSAALNAGHDPAALLYTGPGKTVAEVRAALARGVRLFSTESLADLERVLTSARAAGADVECLIRVNGSEGGANTGVRMTGVASQFGFDMEDAAEWAPRVVDLAGPALGGLHFFPMSNARSAVSIMTELDRSLATAVRLRDGYGVPVRWLDLGGGFAAPYAAPGDRPDYRELRERIDAAIRRCFVVTGDGAVRVMFESGRYLVSAAGALLATVTDVKRSRDRTFVVLDAGVNHLGGMSGLRRLMPLVAHPLTVGGTGSPVTLVGPLCTPNDVLAHEIELPAVRGGDAVVFPNVGAYGLSASLVAFLSRDLPVEVVVDGDREVSVSRQRLERVPLGLVSPVDLCRPLLPVIAEHAARVDADAVFPIESLALLRESGLMGLVVPRENGGLGGGLRELVEVTSALAGACASTAMIFAMHCQQADALVRFASPSLRMALLPRIASGEVYLASVTSERDTGGELLTSAEALTQPGELLVIDRDAPVVTGGGYADGFLVTMRAAPDAPPNQISLVYADRSQLKIEVRGDWNPLGMRATESVGLHLCGSVPSEQLVGAAGRFREVAVDSFIPVGHIGWSAAWLGAARHALARLVGDLRSGRGSSSMDTSSDLFAERLARARADLEAVSAYLSQVTEEVEGLRHRNESPDSPPVQIHLNTLKILASELSFAAVDRMVRIAGLKLGYQRNSPLALERAFRDLRSAALNYSNDRLLRANGTLQLVDREVRLI
jgi:diaminopimelate decarboxylase/alkylation response protein AidB-like acyl-CoA dehydrogenase